MIHFDVFNGFSLIFTLLLQTNLPVFKVKESSVRRRYSDFEWLRNELERDSKVNLADFCEILADNSLFVCVITIWDNIIHVPNIRYQYQDE